MVGGLVHALEHRPRERAPLAAVEAAERLQREAHLPRVLVLAHVALRGRVRRHRRGDALLPREAQGVALVRW